MFCSCIIDGLYNLQSTNEENVRNRFIARKDERRRNRNSLESSEYRILRESVRVLDDGYVSVKFSYTGFQLDQVDSSISPTRRSAFSDPEENFGDYIELHPVTRKNFSAEKENNSVKTVMKSHVK